MTARIMLGILILMLVFSPACTEKEDPKPEMVPPPAPEAPAIPEKDTQAPRVIETFPLNGATDVDPGLEEISVTFNEEMTDGNWSWAYTVETEFPRTKGQPYYTENLTKNNLPVILEPNKQYVIWINSQKFKNFKDKAGNPALPWKFTFKTK